MSTAPLPDIAAWQRARAADPQASARTIAEIYDRMDAQPGDPTWISVVPRAHALARAGMATGPLAGVPFAIKDNIDLAGLPTTAACPDFAYTPPVSSFVVQTLLDAGAVPIGKTNLDQFATGLVGVRSPYGMPANPFNREYIPGGSSSGSAVAVATGLCAFALGTDTAGSGRVPAAFNELVGLKPTRGLLSTRGVVPACRSLDCVSIFTRTIADAATVFSIARKFDPADPFSRQARRVEKASTQLRIGIPRGDQLEFFGANDARELFSAAVSRWQQLGARIVEIDFAPFRDAAKLLYEGAWVAERYAAIHAFIERSPQSLHPITRQIIEGAKGLSAVDAFESSYRLAEYQRQAEATWREVDVLLTPTAASCYRVRDVVDNPLQLNRQLGYYTNYVNLLDLCALAIPAGRQECGVPWGVTLVAPAFHDEHLLAYGARFLGEPSPVGEPARATTQLVVCGAHLSGLPLNHQLTSLGAKLLRATRTAPEYRLYALPGTTPPKPGLVRVTQDGVRVEVEVWEISVENFGLFVAGIPAPLGIGMLRLEDGTSAQGFLCETAALGGAEDISRFGGWRNFLAKR